MTLRLVQEVRLQFVDEVGAMSPGELVELRAFLDYQAVELSKKCDELEFKIRVVREKILGTATEA